MHKYIIISIIIATIIFLFYKKNNIKTDTYEHFNNFEVYSEDSLQNINNLVDAYSKIKSEAKFNKLISKNITAETLNKYSIIKLEKAKVDYNTGDILRYNTNDNVNAWINSPPVKPQWTTMMIYGTLKPIKHTPSSNVLNRESYAYTAGNTTVLNLSEDDKFNFPPKTDGSSNFFYSFNGPFNDKTNKTGLRYDSASSSIVGFDPKKLYKIDCTLSLYYAQGYNAWSGVGFKITDANPDLTKLLTYGETSSAAHSDMTIVLRVGCYTSGIEWRGIQFHVWNVKDSSPDKDVTFWGWDSTNNVRPHPCVNVSILVEEIRKGL
jgi:hypothetical protein